MELHADLEKLGNAVRIPLGLIDVPSNRLRPANEDAVERIRLSIEQNGQQVPLEVTKLANGRYRLVTGLHRLEALRRSTAEGTDTADCLVIADEATQSTEEIVRLERLHEIDENLARHELDPVSKAVAFRERRDLYYEQHPNDKRGRGRPKRNLETDSKLEPRFDEACLGINPRKVRQYLQIAKDLTPKALYQLSGSDLRVEDVKKLSGLPPALQDEIVGRVLAGDDLRLLLHRTKLAAQETLVGVTPSEDKEATTPAAAQAGLTSVDESLDVSPVVDRSGDGLSSLLHERFGGATGAAALLELLPLAQFADEVSGGAQGCIDSLQDLLEGLLRALMPREDELEDGQLGNGQEVFEALIVARQDLRRVLDQ